MSVPNAHAGRAHDVWSASSTARNWVCPGAIALSTLAGDEKESEYAAVGTAAHECAERALRNNQDPTDYIGEVVKTKHHEIEVDQEIAEGAAMYVEYVRSKTVDRADVSLWLETRFSLASLRPPLEAGGTCDAVIYDATARTLEVVDLKYGRGVVEAEGNKQLRMYALGAMLSFNATPKTVTVTIVQPRAAHKDGRIRSESFDVSDLVTWSSELLTAIRRSHLALKHFEDVKDNSVQVEEWGTQWLQPGNCYFCPALGYCPAARKDALKVTNKQAAAWFEAPQEEPLAKVLNTPEMCSPEALGHILDGLEALEDWIRAVRGYAHAQAENGVEIPGYALVQKIGNRAWIADEGKVLEGLKKAGLTDDDLYVRKLVSPAQADKLLGKKKADIKDLWENPIKGTNLSSVTKTVRKPVASKAEAFFEKLEN